MRVRKVLRILSSASKSSYSFEFIHSGYFYSASSSPLLLKRHSRHSTDTIRSFTPMCQRQLRVKDLPKVYERKATNLPISHHAPRMIMCPPKQVRTFNNAIRHVVRNRFQYVVILLHHPVQ